MGEEVMDVIDLIVHLPEVGSIFTNVVINSGMKIFET